MAADEPRGDGPVQLVEMAGKEMVSVIHDGEFILAGKRRNELGNFVFGAMFIVRAMDKELGFIAAPEVREIGGVNRQAETNQIADTRIGTTDAKANPASETETGEKQGDVRKFRGKKIDGGLDVALLALAAVV
jgi:hypothetical protein